MNVFVLTIVGIILLSLIVFTVRKNNRDRKSLGRKLNRDYDKPEKHPSGTDPEDLKGG